MTLYRDSYDVNNALLKNFPDNRENRERRSKLYPVNNHDITIPLGVYGFIIQATGLPVKRHEMDDKGRPIYRDDFKRIRPIEEITKKNDKWQGTRPLYTSEADPRKEAIGSEKGYCAASSFYQNDDRLPFGIIKNERSRSKIKPKINRKTGRIIPTKEELIPSKTSSIYFLLIHKLISFGIKKYKKNKNLIVSISDILTAYGKIKSSKNYYDLSRKRQWQLKHRWAIKPAEQLKYILFSGTYYYKNNQKLCLKDTPLLKTLETKDDNLIITLDDLFIELFERENHKRKLPKIAYKLIASGHKDAAILACVLYTFAYSSYGSRCYRKFGYYKNKVKTLWSMLAFVSTPEQVKFNWFQGTHVTYKKMIDDAFENACKVLMEYKYLKYWSYSHPDIGGAGALIKAKEWEKLGYYTKYEKVIKYLLNEAIIDNKIHANEE